MNHSRNPRPALKAWAAPGLAAALLCSACAFTGPWSAKPGESLVEVRQRLGPGTAEYPRPDGSRRVEYGGGTFGRQTWMLDFDASGRLMVASNVRTEAVFSRVQPGMTMRDVRELIGGPSRVWAVRYHNQTVWSYRYDSVFCQIFNIGITPQGVVEDTSYGPDPLCDDDESRLMRWR